MCVSNRRLVLAALLLFAPPGCVEPTEKPKDSRTADARADGVADTQVRDGPRAEGLKPDGPVADARPDGPVADGPALDTTPVDLNTKDQAVPDIVPVDLAPPDGPGADKSITGPDWHFSPSSAA